MKLLTGKGKATITAGIGGNEGVVHFDERESFSQIVEHPPLNVGMMEEKIYFVSPGYCRPMISHFSKVWVASGALPRFRMKCFTA